MENKEKFTLALQAAFIEGDPERYGHLSEHPVRYKKAPCSGEEFLVRNGGEEFVNVTGDSCTAIAEAFIKTFL